MSHYYLELQEYDKVIKRRRISLASEKRQRELLEEVRKKGQSVVFKVYGQEVQTIE